MSVNPWTRRYTVESFTEAGTSYVVGVRRDGTWGCSCPAWKFHKAPKPDCKHIESVKFNGVQTTIAKVEVAKAIMRNAAIPDSKPPKLTVTVRNETFAVSAFIEQPRRKIRED